MQTWSVSNEVVEGDLPLAAVAHLLEALVVADPSAEFFQFLNAVARVDHMTHVQYLRRRGTRLAAPELIAGHSAPDVTATTAQCFAIYRDRFWRQDECTALAQHLGEGAMPITAVRFTPSDATAPAWRRDVYRRMRIEDRFSILYTPAQGGVFGLNLYRRQGSGVFSSSDVERLLSAAPLLSRTHRGLMEGRLWHKASIGDRAERASAQLRKLVPELSHRECEVCALIACGVTAEGIATDLHLTYSTVTTLRKRAYGKLTRRGFASGRVQLCKLAM